ncbi:cytidine deaminase-like protein [Dissoconium aciculare CBS 342.82]|uniref:Cytosine deaminase n=1 Tax=Dissoconium aciculare CBS 342.82 TaxID=1314786 RepID=A0A6J3LUD0_9PEZI|nr:cytidine deaminase-like protein [Dissoconium aciculare CBS 342.82]KAF1819390.1 cytidine deaminase-like protein [Dissoconium aciculare CBS 342.82]
MSTNDEGFKIAVEEARKSLREGGIPIGACLVSADGKIIGQGHNARIQRNSAILHGEMSALESAGRLPASAYRGATMYTTLSPCDMCSGACILYKVARVVLGENNTFLGGEDYLRQRGIEVINLNHPECKDMMTDFIAKHPDDWFEDIGEC